MSSISSLSLGNASRASIQRIQSALKDATTEAGSLRHADVGRTLGQVTGNAVSYRAQDTSISRMLESNKLVTARLELTDDTMESIYKSAESFSGSLITGVATSSGTSTLVANAATNLQQLVGSLNLNVEGQYYMAGTMSDVMPAKDGSADVKAKFAAFLTASGASGVDTVDPAKLSAYFSDTGWTDGSTVPPTLYRFDDLFDVQTDASGVESGAWKDNWSNANSDAAQSRISKSETIASSVSANEAAFRKVASAYAMISSLGLETMNEGVRSAVATEATKRLKAGMDEITALRSDVGMRLGRVEAANASLTQQKDVVSAAFQRLEGVDETEAALRLNSLKTQLETAYAVTGKLQGLSLLNYL
ncbi:flagellar hook-associated family protein [Aureimonas sp. AU4]|uniref:flagellar hook-associated family protein n=1 Tax=Aureimonas sp. AU4 TaxID=1638163 RepID=UPI0007864867|nr:flagellar hook-associated family protein [Aureimonas sp. AU4]